MLKEYYNYRNKRTTENYVDTIGRLFPGDEESMTRSITFQVTDACNLACSYCYQINKGQRIMKLDYAKKLINMLLDNDEKLSNYCHFEKSPAIILDFIGGEPLLQIDLIDEICDYFLEEAIKRNHRWALWHRISISTNGILYFDEKVQNFLNKHWNTVSLSITLDGNKELHDSCRKFPDGTPTYDIVIKAIEDLEKNNYYMGSKLTIAPDNIKYLYKAFKHMVDIGYKDINANTVYEEGWTVNDAKIYYTELIKIANELLKDENKDIYCSLFEEYFFSPMTEDDNRNWCGGTGDMLAMDPDGFLYPCLRYMESSLGNSVEPYIIGHVNYGIGKKQCEKDKISCLECITRKTQSTEECYNCPIARGCAWCSAYNYQVYGTPNKRCTFSCDMHKARALANYYYWNKYYIKYNIEQRMPIFCPEEWALEIISKDEYNKLLALSKN